MKIDLYTRCWNDALMLGFFFRHYDRLVQRYVVYDAGSTDSSLDVLRANPKVEVRLMPPYCEPDSRVLSELVLLENCWKESRGSADWVIVTDIDEHLYHPLDLAKYIDRCKAESVTILPAIGYEMFAEDFPREDGYLCRDLTFGAPLAMWNKMNLFVPDAIEATNFLPGRHTAAPTGRVIAPERDEILLLHYHYVGLERVRERHALYRTRQMPKDLKYGLGEQYSWSDETFMQEWRKRATGLVDIAQPSFKPAVGFSPWWTPYRRRSATPA